MKKIDLTKILKPYEEKWVALSPDKTRVIGNGDTLLEAFKKAQKENCKDPFFLKVPSFKKSFVG